MRQPSRRHLFTCAAGLLVPSSIVQHLTKISPPTFDFLRPSTSRYLQQALINTAPMEYYVAFVHVVISSDWRIGGSGMVGRGGKESEKGGYPQRLLL